MEPMSTAPRDRGILLHFNDGREDSPYECFAVAKYAQWDGGVGHYGEVWETGPGECYTLDSPSLAGWSELPQGSACKPKEPHLLLVRVADTGENGTKPVHMVIPLEFKPGENVKFWVEEHTCPWNLLRFPIAEGTNVDPHGVLEFVACAKRPEGWDDNTGGLDDTWQGWCKVFPILLETKANDDD